MAGTITGVLNRIQTQQGRPRMVEVVLTCTADSAAHSYPATVVNSLAGLSGFDIRGLKLYSVKAYPGAVAPTDGTDLTITDKYGIDLLGGKGTDLVDATSKTWIMAGPPDSYMPAFITGDITVNISNNLIDSAVTTLVLELVGD